MEEILNLPEEAFKKTYNECMRTKITDLDFSGIGLLEQPDLHELSWATKLDLSRNSIRNVKRELFPPNIKELCLDQNKIQNFTASDIPESVTVITIINNRLSIFDGINFKNVVKLDVSLNVIEFFTFPPNIVKADISGNCLVSIDDFPNSLVKLICNDNKLTNFQKINDNLKYIDMSDNVFKELPMFPESMQYIIAKNNDIDKIWWIPENLVVLDLDNNRIKELSYSIIKFPKSLKCLDFSNNMINDLPDLPLGIEEVYLEGNRLEEVPFIPITVKVLDVSDNCLNQIPNDLKKRNIKLKYSNNLISHDSDEEFNLYRSSSSDEEYIRNMFNCNNYIPPKEQKNNNFKETKISNVTEPVKIIKPTYIYIVHKKRVTV